MTEEAVAGDELRRRSWITEGATAGDEPQRGTNGGGCGHWRRALAWDMDGGITVNDALVPGS
uniref:Uncharacterized protein n=1 Tax=Oryza punctata TaxID=4537 RepID=A0A0E0K0F3_ORYPU